MAVPPPRHEPGGRSIARQIGTARRWYWLLLVPLVGTLIPPMYNAKDPVLIGIPFFYWYQMVMIPVSAICTLAVYRATKGRA